MCRCLTFTGCKEALDVNFYKQGSIMHPLKAKPSLMYACCRSVLCESLLLKKNTKKDNNLTLCQRMSEGMFSSSEY